MDQALKNPAEPYGFFDRVLHRLAFSLIDMQLDLSAREDRQFQAELAAVSPAPPVFITALPRAGTTLLLDVLAAAPEFAAHTYRDMPFLFCPLTWQRFSSRFRREANVMERAHGDGLQVGFDSVEAFEEALWLHFWPEHYEGPHIAVWTKTAAHAEFELFLGGHMRKTILKARGQGKPDANRYLSKNNANIARPGWLKSRYPEAAILVPFRHPAAHIASLARQHRHFAGLHASDPFAKRYMADLGHFEFGQLHKPVGFTDFPSIGADGALDEEYWAKLWIAAYRNLLLRPDGELTWVDFDALCINPIAALKTLATRLGLRNETALIRQASRFRPPAVANWAELDLSDDIRDQAATVHATLQVAAKLSAGFRPEPR